MSPPTPPLGRWKVSFEALQGDGKCKASSGFLILWPKSWLALVNHKDAPIVGKHLKDGEVFYSGSFVKFSSHMVFVQSCLVSPPGFSSFPEAPPVRWRVTYAPLVPSLGLESKPSFARSAFLILKPHAQRLVLLDSKEQVIDARFLLINEKVRTGVILDLKVCTVLVGERIISDSIEQGISMISKDSVQKGLAVSLDSPTCNGICLDFSIGKSFADNCMAKFGLHVVRNKSYSRRGFILVASFGRARFKLDIHTVAIALQACFGGHASLFDVKFLRDRSFSFCVTSSAIGFEIYNLSKFCNTDFELFVSLWGNGGPNWISEEKKFYREQDQEWKQVQKKISPRKSIFHRL
jgi:hypothetical protein